MSIIDITISRALKMLDAAGCAYAVIKPDGDIVGTLELAIQNARKTRKTRHPRHDFKSTGYIDKITKMEIGDVVKLDAGKFPVGSFRSAISALASTKFGKGSHSTWVNGKIIEIFRYG